MMPSGSPLRRAGAWLVATAALPLVASTASGASKVNVLGTVAQASGEPVAGARVELLDAKGNVVAAAETGERGSYALPCVETGIYTMRLACSDSCRAGEEVAAPVGPKGLTVRWTLPDDEAPIALASASGGACSEAGDAAAGGTAAGGMAGALGGAGGTIGGVGIAAGAGAIVVGGTLGGLAASGAFDSGTTQTSSQ